MPVDEGSEADLREIKQQLESTMGADELQQKLTRAWSRISESESGSMVDRKSLNGSLKRYVFFICIHKNTMRIFSQPGAQTGSRMSFLWE